MGSNWGEKKLGFGLMRLPNKDGQIDIPAVCKLADEFLEKGFTYFDTAYVYAGSEVAFREAVVKRHPRESFTVASKLAGWLLKDGFGPEDMFNESLERCGVEYFDFYMLHSLQQTRVAAYEEYDCWNFGLKKKAEGKIRNFGFSYHGDPELLEKLLTEHPEVDFVQLQINYVDWDDRAIYSGANYEVCRKHGKDVIVMEPVKGGFLANLKPEAMAKFENVKPGASAASFALRFAASLPGVEMVLSGMNTDEQMQDNIGTFGEFVPVNEAESQAIKEVTSQLLSLPTVPCTDCRYCCDGCPVEINIPDIFKAYNMILTFGDHNRPHFYYDGLLGTGSGKANACVECGQCEAACPQHIDIIAKLKEASKWLDK